MSVPVFGDFGKALSDLLSKNYYKARGGFELTSKRVSSEVTLESKVGVAAGKDDSANPTSSLKVAYKIAKVGEVEADLNVDGKAKATLKADKVVDKLTLKVSANSPENDKDLLAEYRATPAPKEAKYVQTPFVTLQADYNFGKAVASATVNTNGNGAIVDASLSAGQDGVAVGGAVKLAVNKKDTLAGDNQADLLLDYTAGAQYSTPEYTVGASVNKANKYTLGYSQNVAKDYSLGSSFEYSAANNTRLVTVGSSYKPSSDVLLKAKANVGKKADKDVFTFTGLWERKFANPQLKLGATVEFDANQSYTKPAWYGVAVALGDN